jgi:hypothetical protein
MSGANLPGDLLILGSAACWGCYTALSLPLLRRYSPLDVAAYPMLFGGLAVSVFASFGLASTDLGDVDGEAWLTAAYSTLFATAFAFAAWQRGSSASGRTGCSSIRTWSPSPASSRASCCLKTSGSTSWSVGRSCSEACTWLEASKQGMRSQVAAGPGLEPGLTNPKLRQDGARTPPRPLDQCLHE